jgi:hypothetical protein
LFVEPLEDRMVLSGLFATVGPGLEGIFNQLQVSVNEHLLAPNNVSYSLPLVGTQLGQTKPNDPVGQEFAILASNQIASAFQKAPSSAQEVVNDLQTALKAFNPTITNPVNTAIFTIQASTTTALTEQVDLHLGLPGLSLFDVTASHAVNAHLTFSLNLTFGIDQRGVFVDPTNSPLLQVEVKADLQGFPGVTADLNGVPVQVTDNSPSPSQLDVPVSFNASAQAPIHNFSAASLDQVNFANSAAADVNLHYAMTFRDAPNLTLDLGVQWPLTSTKTGVSPFDSLNDGQIPTVTFNAGVDLSTLAAVLNPASSLFQEVDQHLQPLKDVLDFFYDPLPVLDSVGITVTPRDLLNGISSSLPSGFLNGLDELHDFLDAVGNFSPPPGALVNLASSTLPSTVDPRTSLSSTTVLNAIEGNASTQPDQSQIQNVVDPFIQKLGTALDGTIQLPILAAPSLAFDALLNSQDNVALVQYTINTISLPVLNVNLGPPIGPIVPPFPIFLQLTAGFGLTAGFSIGYDTFGFHNSAGSLQDGLFLADASAQVTGQIGISGELDIGVLQAGANGSISMSFGVTGINTGAPSVTQVQTKVDSSKNPVTEGVLQLSDLVTDVGAGGPFCPFNVGGSLGLSLSVFVTIGVGPFSISFDYPIGDVTLFDFSCGTCQPPGTVLGEKVTDLNHPQVPGLPKADILQKFPGTTQLVVLDMGDYAKRRQSVKDSGAASEDFEISLPTDPTGIKDNSLVVQAFGAVQENTVQLSNGQVIPGFENTNNSNTTIVALDDQGTLPESIKVDPGVKANVYFLGGHMGNDFEYLGSGNTFMQGGTWNASQGDPAQLKQPIQTLNTLVGGFGQNTLIGGNLSSAGYNAEKAPQWNVLIANPAESPLNPGDLKDGGGHDTLQAGTAGATMKGGALGGDTFNGSRDPSSTTSQYVMIAGKKVNPSASLPPDTMNGGYGQYAFEWQEGAVPLTVNGNGAAYQPSHKELDVWGSQANETWTIGPESVGQGVKVTGQDSNQKSIGPVDAYGVQTVSVDAEQAVDPSNPKSPIIGGETYIVNDMSTTGVTQVNVNLHQFLTTPDVNADHVVVNGPTGDDTVGLYTKGYVTGQTQDGQPIYGQQWTEMQLSTIVGHDPFGNPLTANYKVDTALPKSSDTLNLNTFGGADNVLISATQPDQTTVATGAGDDTISVGFGGASLDDIEGSLVVDGGPGHNQISFGDAASQTGDILTLTTSLKPAGNPALAALEASLRSRVSAPQPGPLGYLVRYKGQALPVTSTRGGPTYRYPLAMAFLASGGDFSKGVLLVGTSSTDPNHPDQIYADSILPNAKTTVKTNGQDDQVYVGFDGGRDGATSDPKSTLDYIESLLAVNDVNGTTTSLRIDDEGTARPDTYAISGTQVTRQNAPVTIQYQSLAALTVVAAARENNTIDVTGTAPGTNTTVDTGDGNNTITVADASHTINQILGPLTLNGGAGTNSLTIDDSGNGQAQTYQLTASELKRLGPPPITVDYHRMFQVTVEGGSGANTYNIDSTSVPTTLQTGSGSDTVVFSPTVHDLADIQGAVTVQGGGNTSMTVHDEANAYAAPPWTTQYALSNSQLTRVEANPQAVKSVPIATIRFAGIQSLQWDLGNNTNQVSVEGGAPSTTIQAGTGSNTINLSPSSQNLDWTWNSLLTLWGNGSTILNIYDQSNSHAATSGSPNSYNGYSFSTTGLLRSVPLAGIPAPVIRTSQVNFSSLTQLNFWAAHSTNQIAFVAGAGQLSSSPTACAATLHAGTPQDKIKVVPTDPYGSSTPRTLTVDGDGGQLIIDDTGSPPTDDSNAADQITDTATLTVSDQTVSCYNHYLEVQLVEPPDGSHQPPRRHVVADDRTDSVISYGNVGSLFVNGGPADTTYAVQSTPSGIPLTVNAGSSGLQHFQVGNAGSVKGIRSLLTLNGPVSGLATLTVDDSQSTAQDKVTITPDAVGEALNDLFFGPGGGLGYSSIDALFLDLSNAPGDTVRVTPSPATAITVNGNAARYQAGQGAQLTLDLTGVTLQPGEPQGSGSGTWTFGNRKSVSFNGMAKVVTIGP